MSETTRRHLIEPNRNLEAFSLLWCDANVHQTEENRNTQSELRDTINYLKTFININESEQYVKQSENTKIILIVSGKIGEQLVASVITTTKDLIEYISIDHIKHREIDEVEMKFDTFNLATVSQQTSNASFIWFRLLIEHIIRLTEGSSVPELIQIATQQYNGNKKELDIIDEFSSTFSPSKSLYWYTGESFLYRLLNKSLRETDIDMMIYFRSIIQDLNQQLALEKPFDGSIITVYRGQIIDKTELCSIRSNQTSYLSLLKKTPPSNGLEAVLLEIEVDTKLQSIKPFADITYLSVYQYEEEILFSLGCLLKVKEVVHDANEDLWVMKLVLCSVDDSSIMKDFYDEMKSRINENVDLISFTDFLYDMNVGFDTEHKYR
ncbi:unnamed protein product [Rotaria sp. Silwood2]|nr:unnamed protein product [Rotaria sp. Silwood2]CAF3218626.1 unnamed protein product [Rotaria sp. Silwood2]CAF4415245.1 unnamed protein product [Rotaria sp. Silwood2]CAF4605838.1 unnamed protein product [Rotaria sp. Silwood2]